MVIRNIGIALCILLGFVSCDQDGIYDNYQSISGGWSIDEPVIFTFENTDTLHKQDIFIAIRNNNNYAYSNLFLINTLEFPSGRKFVDTLEYAMANPDGSWLGKGFNDIKESKLWYREGARFRESGPHTISIAHAVRKNGNLSGDTRLQGITEVGLRIEHSKN